MVRGSRFLRRHRPRDTLRQRARPPQHVRRRPLDGERPEVVNSSSSSEPAVIAADTADSSSSDTVARRNRTRPLTVFSVPTARRSRDGDEEPTELDRPEPDSEVFHQAALRREMAPDEFMATAALLGRSYAVPETARRSIRESARPSSSSSATGYTETGRPGVVPTVTPTGRTPKSKPRPKPRPKAPASREDRRENTGTATRREYLPPTPKVRSRVRQREEEPTEDPIRTRRRTWPAGAIPPTNATMLVPALPTWPPDRGRAAERPTEDTSATVPTEVMAEPHFTANPALPTPVDEGLERELRAPDRPWLHNSLTGEPLGPAPIHRDRTTGRLIVTWAEDQTVAFEGRAVLPQLDMKLFLSDLISANDSAAICRSAPVTPPTARQQMITKARTQDEAARRMEDATASHMHGSDTPPGAFAADDAVTQFVAKPEAAGEQEPTGAAPAGPPEALSIFSQLQDATHYFIHSGTSAKDHSQAGLLTIISKRIVDKGSLRFISAIDGRLLRVQFKHGPRQVDVINFYQHTWRPTKHVQSLRHKAWDSLTQQIQAVPLRSRLLVGGDFNTPCTASSPYAGPNVLPKPEHGIQDADDLQAIVQGLDLVFLNTFSQAVPAHTYQWNQQRSQIDFWLTRRLQAGGKAKLAGPMPDFHVGRWRGGPRHMPVQASLMYHWQPWEHRKFQHLATQTEVDRHAILRASSAADDPRIPQFRADVQTLVSQGSLSIEQLQIQVFELACKQFPKRPPQRAEKPWQDGTLTHYAETMWGHFRARSAIIRKSLGKPTLAESFRIWKHTMYFHRLHRAAQTRGKLLRKQKQQELLESARQAAERHDFREHHRLIQTMAPRATYRKFQLRLNGKLLTPEAELREMRTHFETLYQADHATSLTHIQLEEDVPVTPDEILESIQTLQASKAGLPGSSPGAIWRICGDQVAPLVATDLTQRWTRGAATVPTTWSVASLALILKPGKQGTLPTHYRPIGLIDALGKASISMLFRKIRHDLETYVLASPQFAYVQGRSTQEALRRVFHHCSHAQPRREQHARNIHH
ncbi:unnamed protein product [Symbiodinium sp. KB8]|nr:unnamed protein product [Symbiodinium sp. KB8]